MLAESGTTTRDAAHHISSIRRRMSFAGRWQIFGQFPGIAVPLELMHYVVGSAIAFLFTQTLPQSTNELLRAP